MNFKKEHHDILNISTPSMGHIWNRKSYQENLEKAPHRINGQMVKWSKRHLLRHLLQSADQEIPLDPKTHQKMKVLIPRNMGYKL